MPASEQSFIAIIEDDADAAFLLRRLLKKTQLAHRVEHLDDGDKALKFLSHGLDDVGPVDAPDLILLDIKMPKLNGFEVLEWIRTKAQLTVPVIVMTTSDDPSDQQRALALGADAFVSKFPNAAEFRELVTRLLRTNAAV